MRLRHNILSGMHSRELLIAINTAGFEPRTSVDIKCIVTVQLLTLCSCKVHSIVATAVSGVCKVRVLVQQPHGHLLVAYRGGV